MGGENPTQLIEGHADALDQRARLHHLRVTAAIFWLKTRVGWKETTAHEIAGRAMVVRSRHATLAPAPEICWSPPQLSFPTLGSSVLIRLLPCLEPRARFELARAELLEGAAERLPFADATFDGCLSLLVLQEFADRLGTLREMRRVTRPGGVVAACQWDFARMPVIAAPVDAIAAIDPDERERLATRSPDLIGDEAELAVACIGAGFEEVSAGRIKVARRDRDFGDLWMSLLGDSTPSTLMLTALPSDKREGVRRGM